MTTQITHQGRNLNALLSEIFITKEEARGIEIRHTIEFDGVSYRLLRVTEGQWDKVDGYFLCLELNRVLEQE